MCLINAQNALTADCPFARAHTTGAMLGMRIVQVDTFQWRQYGRAKVSTGQKLYHGFIRNDFSVYAFSDRDIAAFEAPFRFRERSSTHIGQP